MAQPNGQITAVALRIDGVSELDPEGHIPLEQLTNGTTGRITRWADFPGQPGIYTELTVYWRQPINSPTETNIFINRYYQVDDRREFTFPITPQMMNVDGTAEIRYLLEHSANGNFDPSPIRKLTIDHAPAPTMAEPKFPDATLWGYLNCTTPVPVWQKVRVQVLADPIFQDRDECVLEWQGFGSLNGSGPALTPVHQFRKVMTLVEAANGFVIDVPFDPYVRPMVNNHSAIAQYVIYRGGAPIGKSKKGLVKIDRIIPGETEPCGGFA
ncbi:hypothetical protein ACLK1G_05425 [Pseudomonas sp. NR3]|uniref:hypothetical protein n=1 Tax=Pseudomonas sp. NR3 TaxID=3155978 RepID=UPI003B680655